MGNELSSCRIEDKSNIWKIPPNSCQNIQGKTVNNFACIALSLKYTTDLVHETVERTMKNEYETWPEDIRNGFMKFMGNANRDQVEYIDRSKRHTDEKAWKLNYNDKTAEKILDTIVRLHRNPKSEHHFNWKSGDNSEAQPYWVLAKIFMPYGNDQSAGVGFADPLSILTLLKNCTLFKDFDEEGIDKMIEARNVLMHSVPQYISNDDKINGLDGMINFLQSPPLQMISKRDDLCKQLTRVRDGDVVVCDASALKIYFHKWIPGLSESEIRESANYIMDNDTLMKRLLAQKNNADKEIDRLQKKKETLETVGGVVGVVSTGAVSGAVGGGAAGVTVLAAGAVATALGVTVAAPAVIVGGILVGGVTAVSSVVGGLIGWKGGRAGGGAVADNRRS